MTRHRHTTALLSSPMTDPQPIPTTPETPGPPSDDAWKTLLTDSIANYERITGKPLDELPFAREVKQCHTVDDFCGVLAQHKKSFGDFRSQDRKIRGVLKSLASVLQFVVNPVAEGTSGFVPGGKGILVAFAAFLEAANRVSNKYDTLELILNRFEPCLTRLDIYLVKLPPSCRQLLHNVLLRILGLMMKTFGLLTLYLRDNPKPRTYRLWQAKTRMRDWAHQLLQDEDVQGSLNELDQLTNEEDLAMSLENLLVAVDTQKLIVDQDVRTWLSPYNTGKRFDDLSLSKHDGTCDWFFDEQFEKWIGLSNSMYWVHGKPGAGKSVSISAVVEHLQMQRELFAFAFISYHEPASQLLPSILSALVYQLATQTRGFHNLLQTAYNQRGPTLSASPSTLLRCLVDIVTSASKRVILVIDGLDEYPHPRRTQELLPLLQKLHEAKISNLRLLLASRPEQDIAGVLGLVATHVLDLQEKTDSREEDILSFVRAQIWKHHPNWSAGVQRKVEETLTQRANGMFLWVSLQMSHLLTCETGDIESQLADLPLDLKGTYDQMMERLQANKSSFHRSQRLLDAIAIAPHRLRVTTAAAIVMVDLDWVDGSGTPQPLDLFDAQDVIRRRGSAFLQINQNLQVEFVHFTAQEYVMALDGFEKNQALATYVTAFTTVALLGLAHPKDSSNWYYFYASVPEADVKPLVS
ncbi:unnamed protein product [Mycena citricolor]|uniref:NACHT domain-containing protein n=1 Tax=Mycena citricolor TaxID=2018698 RepID=A0AAD2JZT6_9AGAR|nr:unnamed protein product [Mycena citricolor]